VTIAAWYSLELIKSLIAILKSPAQRFPNNEAREN